MATSAINIALNVVGDYANKLTGLNQGLELVGKGFGLFKSAADLAFSAFSNTVGALTASFNQVGNQFEQIQVKLETIFGGAGPAQKALDWAADFGAKTPLTLDEVTSSIIKLKTFGFDPFDGTLQKIGDAAFALGTDFDGIVTALGQMQLKGKVSAEELMQLAERNVPVYDILRERFKLTADQLGDIGRQGLDVKEAVKAIVDGLGTRFSGAMQKASNTAQGAFSTIGDIVTVFQKNILDAGVWETYVSQIIRVRDVLAETLGGEQGKKNAKAIGETITAAMKGAISATEDFVLFVKDSFPGLITFLTDFWENPKASSLGAFYSIKIGAASMVNAILDGFQVINSGNIFTGLLDFAVSAFSGIGLAFSSLANFLVDAAAGAIDDIANLLEGLQRTSPSIAKLFGLDDFDASGIRSVARDLEGSLGVLTKGLELEFGDYLSGTKLDDFNGKLEKLKFNLADIPSPKFDLPDGFNGSVEGSNINITLKDDRGKDQQQDSTLNESEVLQGLVKLLTSALAGKAITEDLPLAVAV